jgi:GT2 family glycosyltransferase
VSVIVVCWNSAEVLGRCLDQLFAQDYPNVEIIVVDDGSSDHTLEVAEAAQRRGGLAIVRSRRNRGCPHARNLGLRQAKGEIVAFIDADGFATPSWLRKVVDAFEAEPAAGGVASTVFVDSNPMVLNGAGGTVNRQGWAADLSMSESYESAEIDSEVLYPMGCGMALRRSAVERVGPFDDRMLNYYDDVDYGVRLWRAGYRVIVAPDAWIDHGFGQGTPNSLEKRRLCERHRMRVVLKHASAGSLARWAMHEVRGVRRAPVGGRAVKLRAIAWNARRLGSVVASRWGLRRAPRAPDHLISPSWGDGFPAGLPPILKPRSEFAVNRIAMTDPASNEQLVYGWFPVEHAEGRSYRWAGVRAAALMRLEAPVQRFRLEYAHVPVDTGGVAVGIRRLGSPDRLSPVWSTHLSWQYVARSVENHPVALPPGEYELVFSAGTGWSEPPLETRSLALALASASFDAWFAIDAGGLDMASYMVENQLVNGWFEPEESLGRLYRWGAERAALVVQLTESVRRARITYRLPPIDSGVKLTISSLDAAQEVSSTRIEWRDADWHEDSFPVQLAPGKYMIRFEAEIPWSNPGQTDPSLWAENRSLGFALSSLSFDA